MDVKIQRYLWGSKHFRNPKLPLTVGMRGYLSSVDKWHRHEDFYELVIVCSGSARNENRAVQEQLHAGNVFLMRQFLSGELTVETLLAKLHPV